MPRNDETDRKESEHPGVAIVTGAGSGIGRALCTMLAADGYRIVLVGRDESKLRETISQSAPGQRMGRSSADSFLPIAADISHPEQCRAVIDRTIRHWGRIDALINNAAIVAVLPIDQTTEAALGETFAANFFGPAHLIGRCWPIFNKQGSGRIVNVSSLATTAPFPGLAIYAASKAALESMTRSIMIEGQGKILAFSIVLGAVETSMLRSVVTREQLPPDQALEPAEAAAVIADCARGRRDAEAGKLIVVSKLEL